MPTLIATTSQSLPRSGRARGRMTAWFPLLAGCAVVLAAYATLLLPGRTVDVLVEEDSYFEWAGAIGLLAAAVLFLIAAVRARRGRTVGTAMRVAPWVLLALAAVTFLAGGEEISWGQRLFGWGTPSELAHINVQDETNLHNLKELQGGMLDPERLFRLGWLVLFGVLPIAAALWRPVRRRVGRWFPIAPLWLGIVFVFNYVMTVVATKALDGATFYTSIYSPAHATQEIQEAISEMGIGVLAYLTWRAWRTRGRMPGA